SAPRWLQLRRTGSLVEGFESADGQSWTLVGRARLRGLTPSADTGMFATSPSTTQICERSGGGSTSCRPRFEASTAVFDSVTITDAQGHEVGGPWSSADTSGKNSKLPGVDAPGTFVAAGGRYTVSGAGDLGLIQPGGDNDTVRDSLTGILVG